MRLGQKKSIEDILFSLNKPCTEQQCPDGTTWQGDPVCACVSSSSSSSSSQDNLPSSSSSSGACGSFDSSVTTVFGANSGDPSQYYASVLGISISTISAAGTLQYNNLSLSGVSIVTYIRIGGTYVAVITVSASYATRPMSFTYGGVTYCGTFVDGTLDF